MTTFILDDGSRAMAGSLDMGNNRIINVANATAGTDALNRTTGDGRYLKTNGTNSMTGGIDMGGHSITNVSNISPTTGGTIGLGQTSVGGTLDLVNHNILRVSDIALDSISVNSTSNIKFNNNINLNSLNITNGGTITASTFQSSGSPFNLQVSGQGTPASFTASPAITNYTSLALQVQGLSGLNTVKLASGNTVPSGSRALYI